MDGRVPSIHMHGKHERHLCLRVFAAACLALVAIIFSLLTDTTAASLRAGEEVLVGFKDSTTNAQEADAVEGAGGKITKRFRNIDTAVVRIDQGIDRDRLESRLESSSKVSFVEPNYRVELVKTPNDPNFSNLWGLYNFGLLGGTVDVDTDATDAWDLRTSASTVVVAVVDTGIDDDHPDLSGNIWTNTGETPGNDEDNDGNGYVDDVYGYDFANNDGDPHDDNEHGTHVAGTIGAVGNNGIGITGVAWQTNLMAVKFMTAGGGGSVDDAISSINYAVANGAHVINASWKIFNYSQAMRNAIENAGSQGVLFVASAGNDSTNTDATPVYPSGYTLDNIVSVAAHTRSNNLASFSNYGSTSVDLAAPGYEIYSTLPGNTYGNRNGTSMASPHVSGAAALYLAANPGTQPSALRQLLIQTVDQSSAYEGKTVGGGRLNAYRLLTAQINTPAAPAPATPAPSAPSLPPESDDEPEQVPEEFLMLKPKPNRSFAVKANRKSRRVKFQWSRVEDVAKYRIYLKGKRIKDGKCFGSKKSSSSKRKKRTCYRLKKTIKDPDGMGTRRAKTTASLRLRVGKYRYLIVAVRRDGSSTRARSRSSKKKVSKSAGFKVISARAAQKKRKSSQSR